MLTWLINTDCTASVTNHKSTVNMSANGLTEEKLQDQRVWCALPRGTVLSLSCQVCEKASFHSTTERESDCLFESHMIVNINHHPWGPVQWGSQPKLLPAKQMQWRSQRTAGFNPVNHKASEKKSEDTSEASRWLYLKKQPF